ncbi:MAG: S8 family serine peptidase, partial [Pseudomonadota bacterium]
MNKKNMVDRSEAAEDRKNQRLLTILVILLGGLLAAHNLWHAAHPTSATAAAPSMPAASESHWIVQAKSLSTLHELSEAQGWQVIRELGLINALVIETTETSENLRSLPGVTAVTPNRGVQAASQRGQKIEIVDSFFPNQLGANRLHRNLVRGWGVSVAVLDSGTTDTGRLTRNTLFQNRVHGVYNVATGNEGRDPDDVEDGFGHGAHIASTIALAEDTIGSTFGFGGYNGIAPDAGLVIVKVLDDEGRGTYADVIAGVEYVIDNADELDIGVMNLSLSGAVYSHYWDDPLNQAVMAAWEAGIVVVVSAGNRGPEPMTIGVPGNIPYVITVGAMDDGNTPDDPSDDWLAEFSSTGPTAEGFVKPEVIAPGTNVRGVMADDSTLADRFPELRRRTE